MGKDEKIMEEEEIVAKRKDKRNRPSRSSSPDGHRHRRRGDESKKSKRHKVSGDDDDEGSRKRKRKKEKEKEKSRNRKEKKSGSKHAVTSHKHTKVEHPQLSSDDYFSKNKEFATWLKEEKRLFFSDLSSESARDLFSEFVVRWNDDKLEPRYYEGIATAPRTSHKWKIRK